MDMAHNSARNPGHIDHYHTSSFPAIAKPASKIQDDSSAPHAKQLCDTANPTVSSSAAKSELKIVVAGNVGSGKTSSIKSISEIPVAGTEAKATERDALHRKETTTTAMDYGIAYLAKIKLHLYGTPGQRRFDFMADILCKGAHGMVVMIDNGCLDPLREIDYYLNQHGNFLRKNPGVIAITHFEDHNTRTSLLDYHSYILQNGFTCPVMIMDARKKEDVQKVFMKLLVQISNAKIGKK